MKEKLILVLLKIKKPVRVAIIAFALFLYLILAWLCIEVAIVSQPGI